MEEENPQINLQKKERRKNRLLATISIICILISTLSHFHQFEYLEIINSIIPLGLIGFGLGIYVVYCGVIKKTGGEDKLLKYVFLTLFILLTISVIALFALFMFAYLHIGLVK